MSQYYTYKEQNFVCRKCKWKGRGAQASEGDIINWDSMEILCPKCYNLLTVVMFPTYDETMKYGTVKEKAYAQKRKAFHERVYSSRLKNAEELPDIDEKKIVITLHEEAPCEDKEDGYIVLYYRETEIWREIRTYEYYGRYIELGNILKEKYGTRLVDFVAEYTTYLGGDHLFAFDKVREFRNSLKSD